MSNPSFEYWLLVHFCRTASAFLNGGAVIDVLDKHWNNTFGKNYSKSDQAVFYVLSSRLADAVENADWVLKHHHGIASCTGKSNPATDMGRLVKKLSSPHPS